MVDFNIYSDLEHFEKVTNFLKFPTEFVLESCSSLQTKAPEVGICFECREASTRFVYKKVFLALYRNFLNFFTIPVSKLFKDFLGRVFELQCFAHAH